MGKGLDAVVVPRLEGGFLLLGLLAALRVVLTGYPAVVMGDDGHVNGS